MRIRVRVTSVPPGWAGVPVDRSIPCRVGRTTNGGPASGGTAPGIVGGMLVIRTVAALDTDLAVILDRTARPKGG